MEYDIYEFPESCQIRKIAASFSEFVNEYVLQPDADRGWTPDLTFTPIQIENE